MLLVSRGHSVSFNTTAHGGVTIEHHCPTSASIGIIDWATSNS